ncbi:AraC family transcriptional regulator [Nitrospirillum iridis]|uniref:AraC-like DNA-binding protein n=1 Tax=Nitrospirillum iridis TaxID=765888 RepID=A0A7X0AWG1_9PROT|nr:AraC family transcriptional regulator [Nitrospirillum iridis]MBB6250345.1 AraC-like DNA-binding protein [Nitrospirillum iridis]
MSQPTLDPFSDLLKFADAQTVVSGGFTAGGAWCIRFPPPGKIKFFAILRGGGWLDIEGEPAPYRLAAGDVFLLPAQRPFRLGSDLATHPVEARAVFGPNAGCGIRQVGDGDDFFLLGAHVVLDPACGWLLADILPPVILLRRTAQEADGLHWLLDQLVREHAADLPGAGIAAVQLAHLLFIRILRAHLVAGRPLPAGWLRAATDARLAPALRLMHGDPGRAWQLGELAKAAAMSRTSFATHFKAVAGMPPLAYLTAWRMRLAERALKEQDAPVSELAHRLGYASESAFSNAFKRVTGVGPRRYRSAPGL